jgi:hypothetical protein
LWFVSKPQVLGNGHVGEKWVESVPSSPLHEPERTIEEMTVKRRRKEILQKPTAPMQMFYSRERAIIDPQWERLKDLSGLNDPARSYIEGLIVVYRQMRSYPRVSYPKLKKQLEMARKWEAYSLTLLQNGIAADTVFLPVAHGPDWNTPLSPEEQRSCRQGIAKVVENKKWLIELYDKAIKRITRAPATEKKTKNSLRYLITALLYKLAGKHLSVSESKSTTKVILEICKIADPDIKEETVKTFITKIVHEDKAWEMEPRESMLVITSSDPDDPPIHLVSPLFPPPRYGW